MNYTNDVFRNFKRRYMGRRNKKMVQVRANGSGAEQNKKVLDCYRARTENG